jgi:hypothetical protein
MEVVFPLLVLWQPIPGGPEMIMFGMFPSLPITFNLLTVSSFPTISFSNFGRYFSILYKSIEKPWQIISFFHLLKNIAPNQGEKFNSLAAVCGKRVSLKDGC